ncbi:hypothetical protein AAMO2058_000973000 [Amorphochlora amoebiformis]
MSASAPLECQRGLFGMPEGKNAFIYLNGAARSPMTTKVAKIGAEAVASKMTPWDMHSAPEDKVKELFGRIIDSPKENIAITPCTSHSISLIALNAKATGQISSKEDAIIIIQNQMSSNVLPWQHLCSDIGCRILIAPTPKDPTDSWSKSILSLDWKGVKVVSIPPLLWTDGSQVDLVAIRKKCEEVKAWLVIDATQAIGVLPLSIQQIQPDFLCASVHKWLYGPYGVSLLYVKPTHHQAGVAFDHHERSRVGGDGPRDLPFEKTGYEMKYRSGAIRFQAGGRPNPILLPMIKAALEQILEWGVPRIEAYIRRISASFVEESKKLGYVLTPGMQAPHIIGLRIPKDKIVEKKCSAVECVWFLKEEKKILVSERFDVIRISPSIYNTIEEVKLLMRALAEFAKKHKF